MFNRYCFDDKSPLEEDFIGSKELGLFDQLLKRVLSAEVMGFGRACEQVIERS